MNEIEQAIAYFVTGYSCSQSIVLAFSGRFGIDSATALRMAGAFGSGMGRMGGTCGTLTGGYMVISLKYTDPAIPASKDKTYAVVREFTKRFKERNRGLMNCNELLECDVSTPEGSAAAKSKRLDPQYCIKFVRDAAELLVELLETEDAKK